MSEGLSLPNGSSHSTKNIQLTRYQKGPGSSVGGQSLKLLLPKSTTDGLTEHLPQADHCYYFPFKTDRNPGVWALNRELYRVWMLTIYTHGVCFATDFLKARAQEVCFGDKWSFREMV